jgi:hypothetical protein
LVVT